MKKFAKILSLVLALVLAFSAFSIGAFAADDTGDTKEFTICSMNINGLPDVKNLLGLGGRDVNALQGELGAILAEKDYDIYALQEDFGYHDSFAQSFSSYPYQTVHSGGLPGGDGMNIISKYPLFNETRTKWDSLHGVIAEGADELTPKGILYSVIELEDGVYLDFYVIHADAYDGAGSLKAREDNFRQLIETVNANSQKQDRPVIVVGDFNTYTHYSDEYNSNMKYYLHGLGGFKDAWVELYNEGNYDNFDSWLAMNWHPWGHWDSVDKIIYRNGGGVELDVTSFEYVLITNQDDPDSYYTDHAAAIGTVEYTKTADFVENTQELKVVTAKPLANFFNTLKYIFIDLFKLIFNLNEIFA